MELYRGDNHQEDAPHICFERWNFYFRKTKKAATVNWNYKSTSDVAKVDAWEIQDGKEMEYYKKTNGKILTFKIRRVSKRYKKPLWNLEATDHYKKKIFVETRSRCRKFYILLRRVRL